MPIVIDTCCLSHVFNSNDAKHSEYIPVYNWILRGRGKMVVGGTKYAKEMRRMRSYMPFFVELAKRNKTIPIDGARVDEKAAELERCIGEADFDDPHIMAMVIISGVLLLCTSDSRSFEYIDRGEYYPNGAPAKYTSSRNSDLLQDSYVSKKHKPLNRLSNEDCRNLETLVNHKSDKK